MTDQIRVSFTSRKRPDIKIQLLLPTKDSKLDVEGLTEGWPRAFGYWEGNVSGRLEWDEENQLLLIYWTDKDLSLVDLTPSIELKPGRQFNFHSNMHKTDDELYISVMTPIAFPAPKAPTP